MQLRFTVGGKKRFLTVQTKAQEQYYIHYNCLFYVLNEAIN